MKNKYKCLIFDVDGTLMDSLQGILNAINQTFKEFGYNVTRTQEEGKTFIGAGSPVFAQRAMKGLDISPEKQTQILERFLILYAETQKKALPFEGLNNLLKDLKKAGYLVCVATNKPQILLDPLMKQAFPDFEFDACMGIRPKIPQKPDPFIVFEIMNKFKLSSDDCLYIGDSEYDYKTAHNAGIDLLIVKYGYGFYNEPWMKNVKLTVNSVNELKDFLL